MKPEQCFRSIGRRLAGCLGGKARMSVGLVVFLPLALLLSACGSQASGGDVITTASGLQYLEVQEGTGVAPKVGQTVYVHYRGTLQDGTQFDSSYDRGTPLSFVLGTGRVIAGWDEGIALMKVGGKAKLTIPPELGYGSREIPGVIPANSTLIFEVELVRVE